MSSHRCHRCGGPPLHVHNQQMTSYDSIDDMEAASLGKRRTEVSLDQFTVAARKTSPIWITMMVVLVVTYHMFMTTSSPIASVTGSAPIGMPVTTSTIAVPSMADVVAVPSMDTLTTPAMVSTPMVASERSMGGGAHVSMNDIPLLTTVAKAPSAPTSNLQLDIESITFTSVRDVLSSIFIAIKQSVTNYKKNISVEERSTANSVGVPSSSLSAILPGDAAVLQLAVKSLRVNIRRLRATLNEAEDVLGADAPVLLAEWVWFFRIMGPASDLAVLLESLDNHKAAIGVAAGSELEGVRAQINIDLHHQLRRFNEAVHSKRLVALLNNFDELLTRKTASCQRGFSDCSDAVAPVNQWASSAVMSSYRRVMKHGRRLSDESTPAQLHDLRKKSKTLRYLVESFSSLWQHEGSTLLLSATKKLQERLGQLQDTVVQQNYLLHLTGQDLPSYEDPEEVAEFLPVTFTVKTQVDAVQSVIDLLRKQQDNLRAQFNSYYKEFDNDKLHKAVKRSFGVDADE